MVTWNEYNEVVHDFYQHRLTPDLKKRVEALCARAGVEVKSKAACKCKERDRYADALATVCFLLRKQGAADVSQDVAGRAVRYVYVGPMAGVVVDGFGKVDGSTSQERLSVLARRNFAVIAKFFRREEVSAKPYDVIEDEDAHEQEGEEDDTPAVYGDEESHEQGQEDERESENKQGDEEMPTDEKESEI